MCKNEHSSHSGPADSHTVAIGARTTNQRPSVSPFDSYINADALAPSRMAGQVIESSAHYLAMELSA